MEFTEENFKKLLETANKTSEEVENYKKALQEERGKRKEAQEKITTMETDLNELQTFKKDLEEKEAKKKGKYEELIAEKDKNLETLTNELTSVKEKAEKFDLYLNEQLEAKLGKIPEDRKEFVSKVLDGKSHEDKLVLLDGFIEDYKPKDFQGKPGAEGEDPNKKLSDYDKAKKSGDISGLLANAPIID